MALTNVLSVRLRPEKARAYQQCIGKVAERARTKKDPFRWTAHQTIGGEVGMLHFVSEAPDWASIGTRDATPEILILRLFGEADGARILEEVSACTMGARQTTGRERHDLSYPPEAKELARERAPFAVVTTLRARPGQQDVCEELIRKIAEAIPKVGDPAHITTYQALIGDLRSYWTVRPLRALDDLDRQAQPSDLLSRAFGAGEGGLVYRTGLEAMESVERSLVMLRSDLSNVS
jgi:hypothetical protein